MAALNNKKKFPKKKNEKERKHVIHLLYNDIIA